MSKWKKAAAVSTAAVLAAALFLSPLESKADTWTLEGESTVKNEIWLQDGSQIGTTIQTNYHAGGITGLAVRNSYSDMLTMFGITEEESYWGVRPILYVANARNGESIIKQMKEFAGTLGGTVLFDYEIAMFKWDGSSNQTVATTSSPIKMTVGIHKNDRKSGESFAMLRLFEGKGTFLYDQDTDPGTVTFDTSDFSGSFVLIRYPSGNTPADQTADTGTSGTANPGNAAGTAPGAAGSGELDDVPKTGDVGSSVPAAVFLTSVLVLAAGVYWKRRQTAL